MSDLEQESGFEVVSKDAVPALELRSDLSEQKQIAVLQQWLQPTDYNSPGNEYMKHLHAYIPGTGLWARESSAFVQWAEPTPSNKGHIKNHGILHVRGVAGSGKSVFAASTICQFQEAKPKTAVLFFFFRQIVEKNHSAKYLVRDFACQLLPHSQYLVSKLVEMSKVGGVDGTEHTSLWEVVSQSVERMAHVDCVVDALDEMDDEDFGFIDKLVDLSTCHPDRLKLLVTSRPIPRINEKLRNSKVLNLKLESSLMSSDVAKYVDVKLLSLNPSLKPETEERVKRVICERAQGLFLHARLITDNLTERLVDGSISEEALPDCLERLPSSLKNVYEEMLKEHARRSNVTKEQQAQILSCVTHSSRPLRLIELGSLTVVMKGSSSLKEGKALVRASCGRLLEILEDESVSVIHHSFTEFLRDESRRKIPDCFPVLDTQSTHGMLAVLCLQYLSRCPSLDTKKAILLLKDYDIATRFREREEKNFRLEQLLEDMQLEYPLLTYATENLVFHIKNTKSKDTKVLSALVKFLVPGTHAYNLWMFKYNKQVDRLSSTSSVLHFATYTDMPMYVIEHLGASGNNLQDFNGRTPLSIASEKGNEEAVKFFLERGADPKSGDRDGYTPLHYSTKMGHLAVVKLLLQAGVSPVISAKPNDRAEHYSRYRSSETPLRLACESNHTDIMALFMPFVPVEMVNHCLHRVRGAKNIETILKTGQADVDCFEGRKTMLMKAAISHNFETMRVLLQYGADPNKRCSKPDFRGDNDIITLEADVAGGPMPVHAFAGYYFGSHPYYNGDIQTSEKCLQLLLENGADINATVDGSWRFCPEDTGFTPLFFTVTNEPKLLSMILKAGADPNARSSKGNSPIFHGGLGVLDLLIAHSADINAKNIYGRTPLMNLFIRIRQIRPNMKILEKFIEHGADVNISDTAGDTVFHHIMQNLQDYKLSDLPLFQLLLRSGVDLNKKNNQGLPPLLLYAPRGSRKEINEGLLQALVESGIDINVRNNKGHNILWWSSYDDDVGTAEKFVRMGADITATAKDGSTLLHHAIKLQCKANWIRYLVSKGIDPNIKDPDGNTLVHLAIKAWSDDSAGGRDTVEVLHELGVSLEEKDGFGRTVLHLASLSEVKWDTARGSYEHWIDIVLKNQIYKAEHVNICDNIGATPLHYAANVSELNVAKLLQVGADPTILTKEGFSPLHIACRARQPNVVGLLVAKYKELGKLEALVNLSDTLQTTRPSLHIAARSGVPESVSILLDSGANITSVDHNRYTALHALAEFPLEDALWHKKHSSSIEGMVKVDEATRPSQNGWNKNDLNVLGVLDLLLEAGANPIATADSEQKEVTPLDLATTNNCEVLVQGLLQHAAGTEHELVPQTEHDDKLMQKVKELLDVKDSDKIVQKAVDLLNTNDYAPIKEFTRLGGDLMATDAYRNNTILHKMVNLGHISLLEYYKNEASRVDQQPWMKEEDNPGTLLGQACERGLPSLRIIKHLVEKIGLDVNVPSNRRGYTYKLKNATPLHFVACGSRHWHLEAVSYFLAQGSNIKAKNAYGQTPLLCAISTKYPNGFWKEETIKMLLDHGADPDAVDADGVSCLEAADDVEVSRILLQYGANITATPNIIQRIVNKLDAAMIQVYVDAGASPNSRAPNLSIETTIENVEEYPEAKGDDDNDFQGGSEAAVDDSGDKAESLIDVTEDSRYPLHSAARPTTDEDVPNDWDNRRLRVVETLIKSNVNFYASYSDGTSVLQAIVEEKGILSPFLESKSFDIERRGRHGRTLLLSACCCSKIIRPRSWEYDYDNKFPPIANTEAIFQLLERGAAVNVVDDQGRTPLHYLSTMTHAHNEDHKKAFATLVTLDSSLIHMADISGFKPLHRVLQSRQSWAMQHLIDHGADVKEADPDGNIALHFLASQLVGEKTAAAAARVQFGRYLQSLDINAKNKKGETPLFLCLSTRWFGSHDPAGIKSHINYALENDVSSCDALEFLVDVGADIFTVDNEGSTLLHIAAGRHIHKSSGCEDQIQHAENLFKMLMKLGLDPAKEDNKMRSAIDIAVTRGRSGIVSLFAEKNKSMGATL